MKAKPPGAFQITRERWLSPAQVAARIPDGALTLIDERVVELHPQFVPQRGTVVRLRAGERVKSSAALGRILEAGAGLSARSPVVAIGGGTVGDVATLVAHLLRRGAPLIHVPTTLLAMVDSSVGGKGAINVRRQGWTLRNAAGVFHYPVETWLCLQALDTLDDARLDEGWVEALKVFACADQVAWRRHREGRSSPRALIRDARRAKSSVCTQDPYESSGLRRILNFGHTFGHALESLSRLRLPHGRAVGLGILCALDIGRRRGVTPESVAREIERTLETRAAVHRRDLARWLGRADLGALRLALAGDKKAVSPEALTMILLPRLGRAMVRQVPNGEWQGCLPAWRRGRVP